MYIESKCQLSVCLITNNQHQYWPWKRHIGRFLNTNVCTKCIFPAFSTSNINIKKREYCSFLIFLRPCSLDSGAHLYCSSSFGSTDRTTGLLSTHSRKGVSSLVLYTSPASHKRIKVVNASLSHHLSSYYRWLIGLLTFSGDKQGEEKLHHSLCGPLPLWQTEPGHHLQEVGVTAVPDRCLLLKCCPEKRNKVTHKLNNSIKVQSLHWLFVSPAENII